MLLALLYDDVGNKTKRADCMLQTTGAAAARIARTLRTFRTPPAGS